MLGKVRDAVADAAETLRRLFADPEVRGVPAGGFPVRPAAAARLEVEGRTGLEPLVAATASMPRLEETLEPRGVPPFEAKLQVEAGWARWGAEAAVVAMAPLRPGGAAGVDVPPLPRRAEARSLREPVKPPAARRMAEPLPPARSRRLDPALSEGAARPGLAVLLAQPIPLQSEDIQRLPKGLWMRYSLQMVRATGENVRNLEVLGLFRLPRKGVADLRHDARRGRILVRLGVEAAGSPRVPFILARRRSDGALLTCYLEEP